MIVTIRRSIGGICFMTAKNPDDLLSHITDDTGKREKECQPFLDEILPHLCRETASTIIRYGREQPNRFGYNDFSVSAVISDGGTSTRKVAFVWEAKAPQCATFEADDHKSRLRPTADLIKAENQLLHYVEEFASSPSYRSYFGLDATSEVVPAGIIIGRSNLLVKPSSKFDTSTNIQNLFDYTMQIRKKYLYKSHSIVVKNWNWVHEMMVQPVKKISP